MRTQLINVTVMSGAVASVIADRRRTFRAVATTVVPEAASLDQAAWADVERIVETALADRPVRVQRQLALLLRVIEHLPRLRYATAFSALSPLRRHRVLERLQDARVLLLRRGFWGLRTLVLMGYYARDDAARAIGYRAQPGGWEARHGARTGGAGSTGGHRGHSRHRGTE